MDGKLTPFQDRNGVVLSPLNQLLGFLLVPPQSWGGEEIGWGKDKGQRRRILPTYPHDFGIALGTDWGKELLITPLTVNIVLLLHKAHICQGVLAVRTVEFFWVPGAAHGYQKGAPGKQRTASTKAAPKV